MIFSYTILPMRKTSRHDNCSLIMHNQCLLRSGAYSLDPTSVPCTLHCSPSLGGAGSACHRPPSSQRALVPGLQSSSPSCLPLVLAHVTEYVSHASPPSSGRASLVQVWSAWWGETLCSIAVPAGDSWGLLHRECT